MGGPLVAFRLGPLTIYWYGIIIMTAALVGGTIASFEAKRRGENEEHIWNMLITAKYMDGFPDCLKRASGGYFTSTGFPPGISLQPTDWNAEVL